MDGSNRVLVTGASGFIGTNLLHALKRAGISVQGLDSVSPRDPTLKDDIVEADLLDRSRVASVVASFAPDTIIHLAARTDLLGTRVEDYEANTTGVEVILDVVAGMPETPRVIYASSRLVFAIGHRPAHDFDYRPSTAYGESKIRGEELVLTSGQDNWLIVRPTSLWGPWFGTPYREFFDSVRRGFFVNVRGYAPRKSFCYVENATHQLMALAGADPDRCGSVYWVSDYEPYLMSEWAQEVRTAFGAPPIRTVPMPVLRVVARIGDWVTEHGRTAPLTTFRLNNLVTDMVYDLSATEQIVGPSPVSRVEGVRRTVAWMNRGAPHPGTRRGRARRRSPTAVAP